MALRGATPVFVDIRPDTLNLDETLIEAAITDKTRSIWVVHYAGVACEMNTICDIASRHELSIVEDAAQGIRATYKGRALGGFGDFGALSFHETKNITCGEGGALLIRDRKYVAEAEIIHQKGTNRQQFIRGQVDKYTWRSIGSSFLLGEMSSAFLAAQFESVDKITKQRLGLWERYNAAFQDAENAEYVQRPTVPTECMHNAHMYYLLLNSRIDRTAYLKALNDAGINAVFHYVPLHSSPAGQRLGRTNGDLNVTDECSSRLVRLPLWADLTVTQQDRVIDISLGILREMS